jgi:hypothetical protein
VRALSYLMPDGVEYYNGLNGTQKFLAEDVAHVPGAPLQDQQRLMSVKEFSEAPRWSTR